MKNRVDAGWYYSGKGETLGLTLIDAKATGAQVTKTIGPSVNSGILVGDVIKEVAGKDVTNAAQCCEAIWTYLNEPKRDRVTLTIQRNDQRTSATLYRLPNYDSGFDPKPVRLPAAYRDYQVLPQTISPDGKYGFIYPKRSRLYEIEEHKLLLVALSRFRILSQIPLGNSNLAGNARCYYAANWAKNSSAAVFIAGGRWGPEVATVVQIRHGVVAKQSDLTAAVRKQVQPDFRKSHAEPYNDYYDFVFDTGDTMVSVDDFVLSEPGWDPDGSGHVNIDCTCTTDPKLAVAHPWTAHFEGVWDIRAGSFLRKKITRIEKASNWVGCTPFPSLLRRSRRLRRRCLH